MVRINVRNAKVVSNPNDENNEVQSSVENKENVENNEVQPCVGNNNVQPCVGKLIQVKLFYDHTFQCEGLEKKVNDWLRENKDSINVIDVKHTVDVREKDNWPHWTVMITYEEI